MSPTDLPPSAPRRYAAALMIPLAPAALVTLAVLSATLAFALLTGVAGIPLIGILLSWFFKYSFALLDSRVAGEAAAPGLSVEMIRGAWGEGRSLLPFVLVITAFFASGASTVLAGELASAALAVAALVWLPAVVAVQAWTGSAAQSVSPSLCTHMIHSLGEDYAWMVGCVCVVAAICVVLPAFVDGMPTFLRIGLLLYAWLAVIAVIGGAVYARRDVLERETALTLQLRPLSLEEVTRSRDRWLDSIHAFWRHKAHANAWSAVTERLAQHPEPIAELRWLYARVARWDPPQFGNRLVQEMLPLLLAADRDGEALRLVKERLAADPGFRPQSPEARRRLGRLAGEWGDRRVAESLAEDPPDGAV